MKISTLPAFRLLTVLVTVLVLLAGIPVATQADKPPSALRFVGVKSGGKSHQADTKLVDNLRIARLDINHQPQMEYGTMITKLVEWQNEHYVARVTPYVYVAAVMMGAEFEVLATYKNNSGSTRYHSYFVVNKSNFPKSEPKLEEVIDALKKLSEQGQPARFVYHDKFSTSSYFVPALEFRRRNIFSMDASSDKTLTAIRSEKIQRNDGNKPTSSDLVKAVADNNAFVAAVWDGTKNSFLGDPENKTIVVDPELKKYADKVYFIQIPTDLPNDLLVCSKLLKKETRDDLLPAITEGNIGVDDFQKWTDFNSEREAKVALADLRHDAEQRAAQVTVSINNSGNSVKPEWVESIKDAIRLSGTELVPHDPAYHGNVDFHWTVEEVQHDKAINLISQDDNGYLPSQSIQISFTDSDDLTKRIGSFIHSRMHRIRYVWPYITENPTVIRDVAFPISSETQVKVVMVTWTNPQKNAFSNVRAFNANVDVAKTTPFSFQLKGLDFLKTQNGDYGFDPMSNVSYRVFLARPEREGRVFSFLTYLFVGLLLLAAAGTAWDIRRKQKARELPILNPEDFKQKCRELADKSRGFWVEHKLRDSDVVWCCRKSLDELIAYLNANDGNLGFNARRIRKRSLAILAHIPVVSKFVNLQAGAGVEVIDEIDPTKFGNTQRLGDTIQYLMNQKAFSPFLGEKLEWDALDEMTADVFKPFRIDEVHLNGNGNGNGNGIAAQTRRATSRTTRRTTVHSRKRTSLVANNGGNTLIRSEHPMVLSTVATHFDEVIEQSKEGVCFFSKNWTVKKTKTEVLLAYSAPLQSPLQLNGTKSTISKLTLQVQVPRSGETDKLVNSSVVNAWVLGKIVDVGRNGSARTLVLNFKPTALVRTDDPE